MKLGIDLTSINKEHNGGKEQVVINLLLGFQELGYANDVYIFLYKHSYEKIKNIIPDSNIIIVKIVDLKKKAITDMYFRTFKLKSLIKKHKIDILFFPIYNTGLRKFSIPSIIIPHDIQTKTFPERFSLNARLQYNFYYKNDFKLRDRIIAVSNYDKQQIENAYPKYKHKIKVIYNPIRIKNKSTKENKLFDKPYIVAINIRYKHKNVETLIKAFERIKDEIPHDLILVGDIKSETCYLKEYVEKNNLQDRIIFTGFLKEEELFNVLKNSSLYVNPSLFEGFGMTAVEAMILKVPTLVSNMAALPEVTKGLSYYYDPPENVQVLSNKIIEILNNPPNATKLEKISKEIHNTYNYKIIAKKYFELFRRIYETSKSKK